nr:unnamed protein product [Callosobruchus chinensis]
MSRSYNKKKSNLEDVDLRVQKDIPPKIIITPEDEHCIKSGNMTKEHQNHLLNKIVVQMEKSMLKEARKKDHEETFNVSLQPISDDELIDSDDDKSQRKTMVEPAQIKEDLPKEGGLMPFNDKDERIGMGHFVPMQNEYQPQFFPRDNAGGFPRRFPGPWRGRGRGRHWDNQPPQMGPRGGPRSWNAWRNVPPQSQPRDFIQLDEEMPGSPEMSSSDQLTNGAVNQDEIKTLNIDGVPKDIRFYDETAVVFINWDDPREISFQEDKKVRHVTFNDKETYSLGLGRPYVEVQVNGKPHMVRIGAPSRELFIDHVPYECYFNSAGIRIELDGVPTTVKLGGPTPQVKIGERRRTDLVAGKITMFVDAVIMVPVFLDAKPQRFIINGETSTLRFVNALETVLINDTPFKVEYGGLPKPIMINGKKRFIRFSVLPKGVRAGRVNLKDMEGCGSASPQLPVEEEEGQSAALGGDSAPYDPAQPVTLTGRDSPERNSNSPGLFHNLLQQQSLSNLDALTNAIAPTFGPSPSSEGYHVENQQGTSVGGLQPSQAPTKSANAPLVNINELFQKLVASGFVTSSVAAAAAAKAAATPQPFAPSITIGKEPSPARTDSPVVPVSAASGTVSQHQESQDKNQKQQQHPLPSRKKTICETLRPVLLDRPETLKIRQAALYSALYSGMQCSSCGMRFSPEASMLYSQHLDWHFRQNRRGKKNARVASSRKWYYSLADWKNYEELEDLEEREKNYFDQQQQAEGAADEADEDVEIPSVPADPESTAECCEVCRDKFDQFFNEEKEEWHLKNAIRIEEKTYHPVCYEDYLQSLNDVTLDESTKTEPPPPEEDRENIPGLEIVNLDDDDDEEVEEASSKPEVVSVESDESKNANTEAEESQPPPEPEDDGDDDDVILNEVAPIKIVVDDDDEDDDFVPTDNDKDEGAIKIKEEELDDGFVEVSGLVSLQNGGQIKIKAEPVDLDDIQEVPGDTADLSETMELEESSNPAGAHPELVPSIDGNVEIVSLSTSAGSNLGGKIKINISKPLPQLQEKDHVVTESDFPSETYVDPFEPFPPGEEPEPVSVKPALKGLKLQKLAPVRRGEELTGLCSIM